MKKLIYNIFILASIILYSGCNFSNLSLPTSKPKINQNLTKIDAKDIKFIADISSVALEWKNVTTAQSHGYYIYRAKTQGESLKRIAIVKSKYSSHYLDTKVKPNTQYLYSISVIGNNDTESQPSESIQIKTQNRFKSVSFLTAISNLPRQIKILWRPHTNQRVNKYIIERSYQDGASFKQIAVVRQRLKVEYIDTKLLDDTTYLYRIKAVTFNKVQSLPSEIVEATTKALPNAVTNIRATQNLARMIRITWDKPQDSSGLLSYKLYASKSQKGYFRELATISTDKETLFEHKINKDNYTQYYKIVTIDKDKLKSTKEVAPVMGKTIDIPAQPTITLAMIKNSEVILNWEPGDNRAVAYNLYKDIINKDKKKLKGNKFINIPDKRFEDKDTSKGITYNYTIEAIDKDGLVSEKTSAITLTIPKSKLEEQGDENASHATN